MKKVLSFILTLFIIVSLIPYALAVNRFPDVTGTWGESYVSSLVDKKIVNGMEDGKYHPNDSVTRGEISKMMVTAMQCAGSSISTDTANNPLPDTAGEWSEKYIVPLCHAGIILPAEYSNGFAQGKPMNRMETIKTVVRTYLHAHPEATLPTNPNLTFTDKASISAADASYVAMGVDLGIINGIPANNVVAFQPNSNILRSEAAAMVCRFLDKCGKFSETLGPSENRIDGSVPTGAQASNLPVIKTSDDQIVEWVIAPTIKAKYPKWSEFSEEGLCYYTDNSGKQVFVDMQGKTHIFSNVSIGRNFVKGLAPARNSTTGKWGYIDFIGKWVIPAKYDGAQDFSKFYFKDGTEGYWAYVFCDTQAYNNGYINASGKFVTVEEFYKKCDLAKCNGDVPIPSTSEPGCEVISYKHTKNGLFTIYKGITLKNSITLKNGPVMQLFGIIDSNGKTLVVPSVNEPHGWYEIADVYDDCIVLTRRIGTDWNVALSDIYDNQGKLVSTVYSGGQKAFSEYSPYRSFGTSDYGEGYFVANDKPGSKHGFMKKDGSLLIPCVFDEAKPFDHGVAWVEYNGMWGLIQMPSK